MKPPLILPIEKRTVTDRRGNGDLGIVAEATAIAINCNSGPIRLLNGTKNGFGMAHIESHVSRVKQIAGLGFDSVFAYAQFIASDYDAIALQVDGRLIFIRDYHRLICQWDADLGVWSVTTAIPKHGHRDLNIVWRK